MVVGDVSLRPGIKKEALYHSILETSQPNHTANYSDICSNLMKGEEMTMNLNTLYSMQLLREIDKSKSDKQKLLRELHIAKEKNATLNSQVNLLET